MIIRDYNRYTFQINNESEVGGGIHPYPELLQISEGAIRLDWMGNQSIIEAPATLLIFPDTPHLVHRMSATLRFSYFELELSSEDEYPGLEESILWNDMQRGKRSAPGVRTIVQQMDEALISCEQYADFVPDLLPVLVHDIRKTLELIRRYLHFDWTSSKSTIPHTPSGKETITTLMRWLESNYFKEITLSEMAMQVHLHPSYLIRLFKEHTGRTPLQYLNELRMNAALNFLSATEMTIQEISERVGYNSIHYFSRAFKTRYRESPTQWRERRRQP